ncbi:MAG: translation initiation factor IF-2 N-terminal domain-containing protein, partial [Alistipes sp.]|nr:translation initiation factor IF-2 N-terminal domain-containing protein [Alistipes sp.]
LEAAKAGRPQPKKEEPKPTPAPAPAATAEPQQAPAPEKPEQAPAPAPAAPAAEPKPAPAPAPEKAAQPETAAAPEKSEQPAAEEPKKIVPFRLNETKLTGPNVLGKMDVSNIVPGGRRKRKRVSKEKITDFNAAQGGGQAKQNDRSNGNNNGGKQHGHGGQNQPGGQNNQPSRKDKKKNAPKAKPVVRPEVSDEEVSKQIKDTLARLTAKGSKNKTAAKYRKEKRELVAERMNEEFEREEMERSTLKVTEFVTVSELATMMNVSATEVITSCMNLGLMVSINQRLDAEALVVVAEEFGFKVEFVSAEIQEAIDNEEDDAASLVSRPPIVTVMGHVDHGKTSLLDNIRKTNVIEGEAGGITQHIGAYSVELNGQRITFLDTPGHEAFTAMRARGAKVTDVAIIIVAADDSVMPQTIEAINHAQAAGVPMVFAINKIDKPNANPDHIKEQLAGMNYLVEEWGGQYQSQDVSAKQGL